MEIRKHTPALLGTLLACASPVRIIIGRPLQNNPKSTKGTGIIWGLHADRNRSCVKFTQPFQTVSRRLLMKNNLLFSRRPHPRLWSRFLKYLETHEIGAHEIMEEAFYRPVGFNCFAGFLVDVARKQVFKWQCPQFSTEGQSFQRPKGRFEPRAISASYFCSYGPFECS